MEAMQLSHASDMTILQESNRELRDELRALKIASNKLKKGHEVRIKVEEELQMEMQALESLQLAGSSSAPQEPTPTGEEKVSLNSFQLIRTLGQGGFGTVVLAKKKLPGGPEQLYAIKAVKKKRFSWLCSICPAMGEREVLILASGHPFIVTLHSCFQNKVQNTCTLGVSRWDEVCHCYKMQTKAEFCTRSSGCPEG